MMIDAEYDLGMPSFGAVVWVGLGPVLGWLIFRFGLNMLRSLGTALPGPPPSGELRRVNLRYRCSLCGVELKMTLAANEVPEAPRHCMEDMDALLPVE